MGIRLNSLNVYPQDLVFTHSAQMIGGLKMKGYKRDESLCSYTRKRLSISLESFEIDVNVFNELLLRALFT